VALAGLGALAVAMGIGRFGFTPILPLMQQDAGLSVAAGGWLASANYVGYLAGAASALVIRIPARPAIRGGLVAIALLTAGMGLEQRLAGWLVLRALAGVASAWVMISVSAWCLDRLAPPGRPVLRGVVFAGVGAGIALAGVSCLALMQARAGASMAWATLGALGLGVTALVWPRVGAADAPAASDAGSALGAPRWDADRVRLVCCYGVSGFGYIVPATFLPVMARQTVAEPWVFGWAWPVFGATAAAATLTAGVARRAVGNRRLWVHGHLVMALGVTLPVLVPGIAGILLAAVCVGGTFMVTTMAGMEEAREVAAGGGAAGLMAAMTASFALGQVAGPVLVSTVAGGDVSAGLLLAGALLVGSAWTLHRRRETVDTSTRMPPLDPDAMTDARRTAAAALTAGPRGGVRGPFVPLLRSPELMDRLQRVGEYLRYHTGLPRRRPAMAEAPVRGRRPHARRDAERRGLGDRVVDGAASPAGPASARERVDDFYVIQRLAEIHRRELERQGVHARLVATIRQARGLTLRSRLRELLVRVGRRLLAAEARRRPRSSEIS
jgi:MFS family permease